MLDLHQLHQLDLKIGILSKNVYWNRLPKTHQMEQLIALRQAQQVSRHPHLQQIPHQW
jgi:hypothetical protein